jgi:hypothetical protein
VAGYGEAGGDGRLVAIDDDEALWVRRLDPDADWEELGSLEEAPGDPPGIPQAAPCADQAG